MVVVFWGGHVSGAHYNPAVTIAILVTMRGKLRAGVLGAICYILAQCLGGFVGALLAWGILGHVVEGPTVGRDFTTAQAFGFELLWTFVLASAVLNTATTKHHHANSFYGLAIGSSVFVGASMGGKISGAAFNPAVGTSLKLLFYASQNHSITNRFDTNLWIYWVGPILGGLLAALIFRVTNLPEYTAPEPEEMLDPLLTN